MTALNIQAAQNDIIRQVLNTQDIHLLDRIRNLFANKEAMRRVWFKKSLV